MSYIMCTLFFYTQYLAIRGLLVGTCISFLVRREPLTGDLQEFYFRIEDVLVFHLHSVLALAKQLVEVA